MKRTSLLLLLLLLCLSTIAQFYSVPDPYLLVNASANDPLYSTFAAAMDRSRLYGDKGYKMDYYSDCSPLTYGSDKGGKMFCIWEVDAVVVDKIQEFHKKPIVTASFPDMATLAYEPWEDIIVEELFFVYSSTLAVSEMHITNSSNIPHEINLYPVLEIPDSLVAQSYSKENNAVITTHYESKKRLISNLRDDYPYPKNLRDVFALNVAPYSYGSYEGDFAGFYNIIKTDFYSENRSDSLNLRTDGASSYIALQSKLILKPGESATIRYYRGVQDVSEDIGEIYSQITLLNQASLQRYIDDNIKLFSKIPRIEFESGDDKILYLSSFNLLRGCMYPPSGKTSHNFYVFSREPLWGWGHGHQVLHESLSMLAYVYLDPQSAQESQRVYIEQQAESGLIAYRHGPRGLQDYPHEGMPTTSSPFFSYINLEIYKVSQDKDFLLEAYYSGSRYVQWLVKNRDTDKDGLYEWGPYGIIENVRDWYNAVFQVSAERYLDVDKEDISDELECLDLSLMIVKEMRCLSEMAKELGYKSEAKKWAEKADNITRKINQQMWDSNTGFFYHINKDDHSFQFMTRDLKRQEIIGFLPMWAEAVSKERADTLVKTLLDPDKFWRKYGVPTLSADDEWYSPYVDYCCKWNGPVWLLWNYMVFEGLIQYGYKKEALELSDRMIEGVKLQLTKNHNFWESYSPDNEVLNCPSNYIWDGIMARVLIEREGLR